MTLQRLVVGGLRGISHDQTLTFAQSNGTAGSGLTILVGTNNAGKSTIIEALRAVSNNAELPFYGGKRNQAYGDRVYIRLEMDGASFRELQSANPGSSRTRLTPGSTPADVSVVPSRRTFPPFFSDPGQILSKEYYTRQVAPPVQREPTLQHFSYRLNELDKSDVQNAEINRLLGLILGYTPNWSIDQDDRGESFLKFVWTSEVGSRQSHNSDGLGDGVVSLFVILDSLRDSTAGAAIVIDEPELSLHPQFQRRLRALLSEMAADRQIIYATHSPYFIDWTDVSNGASISRVHKSSRGTTISTPSRPVLDGFITLGRRNINNPHMLGLDANEVFFLEGGVVLTEGQEDVILLATVVKELGTKTPWSFFGWGVGGAGNMGAVARLLQALGYGKVVGILDNDKEIDRSKLEADYPDYRFECIPASDIRPKDAQPAKEAKPAKEGLIDKKGKLRDEHFGSMEMLVSRVETYLQGRTEIL